ncbi:hypothetical protein TrVE_jg7863 [Triparma verrucosa]|uniref:Uncharacterized protein n=1 Tax=Triparma verrucosa TaxID=1606542 RepID=A0A9W7BD29_9STRA|nr:hypothetical protein TrVE_jg7863 [Triparma verrucosa]
MDSVMSLLDRPEVNKAIAVLGAFTLATFSLKVLSNFYKYFLRPSKNLKKLGEWAVVTGATDGIGKAYAFKLAKKGLNVVLISRTEAKLNAVKEEIEEKYPSVQVKVVVCDYSDFSAKLRTKVEKAVKDLDVGVLVNNVGVSYQFPKYFSELTEEEVAGLMEMNVNSTTWMTHMILPGMMERKRGSIVNIASAAGCHTMPLLAQYSAAKGYIAMFSRGLACECAKNNVTVSCQVPFYVATKLAKMRAAFTVPTPNQFADMAVRWIGHSDVVVHPFWLHAIMGWFIQSIPTALADGQMLSMHASIRKRGLKKQAKLAKGE